jgi:phage baseplate assembly protein W
MAIILRNNIKINPVDISERQVVGIRLPFGKRQIFVNDYTTKDHAKSKLTNLLLTVPGERLNLPFFGVGLKQFLFEQITEETSENLKSVINNQVSRYIPEIEVSNIRLKDKDQVLHLTINYKVLSNSENDSITLSFTNTNFENQL